MYYHDYMKWFDFKDEELAQAMINFCDGKYEIKSNYDNINKLNSQIPEDYVKMFSDFTNFK